MKPCSFVNHGTALVVVSSFIKRTSCAVSGAFVGERVVSGMMEREVGIVEGEEGGLVGAGHDGESKSG